MATVISPVVRRRSIPALSYEARVYAVRELARRAGVSDAFLSTWKVICAPTATSIAFSQYPGTECVFPHVSRDVSAPVSARAVPIARFAWTQDPGDAVRELVPDFIVPFATGTAPLFVCDQRKMTCNVDLLQATVLTLSRYEETLDGARDEHGRFPAAQSCTVNAGVAHRPFVDEYALAFAQALQTILPNWTPNKRTMRVHLSHDIDHIGVPLNPRNTLGHVLHRHNPTALVRDLAAAISSKLPAFLNAVLALGKLSAEFGLRSAAYWKACGPSENDSGYDIRHPKVRATLSRLREDNVEIGVHPGYLSFGDDARFAADLAAVREVSESLRMGGRQHYLRWQPDTWKTWERFNLVYDSTVGYSDRVGFRAGTCHPYRPWLMDENRAAALLEVPLIIMDIALPPDDQLSVVAQYVKRCELVGGVFSLLWHNNTYVDRRASRIYRAALQHLSAFAPFDALAYSEQVCAPDRLASWLLVVNQ